MPRGVVVVALALALRSYFASGATHVDLGIEEVGRSAGQAEGYDNAIADNIEEDYQGDPERDDRDVGGSNDEYGVDPGDEDDDGYGVIDAERAVTHVRSLPGPDFTKGDAAWQERLAELVRRRPNVFSKKHMQTNENAVALATAAPLTTLYALARNHDRLSPVPKTLRVHVLGAAYSFEGRGDWRLLGEAMPPGVSLEVSLVLGTPREADGVPEMERIRLFKRRVCREHGATKVRCIESYYQDVMEELERPHLAIMFNPGFPQVHRRTWDKALLFLLRERIPTAVSAQVTDDKGWPDAGRPWDSSFYDYANEDFPINETLEAYGADVWSTTGSPFFIVVEESEGLKFIKNGVIEIFQGLREGAKLPPPPAPLPPEDVKFLREFDWRRAERVTDDDSLHNEMRSALMTPVSDAFVRAADTVYLRYLRDVIDFRRKEARHGFRLRGRRRQNLEKLEALMERMRRMERLGARDWVFIKTSLDLD
jgi:hypothetical protein